MINLKVSELMNYIKVMTSKDYVLSRLTVEGEISNLTFHSNGTAYFTIKDEYSGLRCVFHNFSQKKDVRDFKNGDQVGVLGKISLYEKDGNLSMLVEDIEKIGLGKLYENFLILKEELDSQGYFDDKYKKEIPKFPKNIGVITSKTGAAIKDIVSVIKRRNEYVNIYLFPAVVQGSYAKDSLIQSLEYFENKNIDVVIIGRGGGSYEDLDAFNSKELALKIFNYPIPIISAVGHEIDFVITDFVSDKRAATPSVAAEIVAPDMEAYKDIIRSKINRIMILANKISDEKYNNLKLIDKRLTLLSIDNIIENKIDIYKEKIIYLSKSIENKVEMESKGLSNLNQKIHFINLIERAKKQETSAQNLFNNINLKLERKINLEENRLLRYKSKIDKLDIKAMISQGYSIITDKKGNLIKSINDVNIEDLIEITLSDGNLGAKVKSKEGI